MDIPSSGAIFTLGRSYLADNTQSYFYIKNDPVKRLISGPMQSAVICESGRLFVWGENHYGQLGIGGSSNNSSNASTSHHNNNGHNNNNNNHGDIITKPTCVKSLKTLGLKISDIAFGNDWAVILTHSNELFFTGRSIFAADSSVARNFMTATVANEQCDIIRKPFRLEELDDCLTKSEDAESYTSVLAGNEHFAVMTTFGRLIAWGSNQSHQLGLLKSSTVQGPCEINVGAPIQQFVCGPASTLVLTTTGKLYFTGRLNDFVFSQFTELQQNLSPTEQIIFMHISKTNEIYIVTNAGTIYRSIEAVRNKSLIFQRFYDYDSEENGPIWKLLKGFSFYAVLTKANKFYTTFSESGHHLKTFREISKFKNLRLLDMAVGDQHILVHGIPRSSSMGTASEPHRFMSRTYVMPTPLINGSAGRTRSDVSSAAKTQHMEEFAPAVSDVNSNELHKEHLSHIETPKPNTPVKTESIVSQDALLSKEIIENEKKTIENGINMAQPTAKVEDSLQNIKNVDSNGNSTTNGAASDVREEVDEAKHIIAATAAIVHHSPKSPTESMRSRKSTRSIKFEQSLPENSPVKMLRPRTPYPESSTNGSTPQTIKKTPLRNYSYEAAMDHDYIEHTSPALMDSLENIPESAEADREQTAGHTAGQKAVETAAKNNAITAVVSSPTPPYEEDEQLTVEINTTTDPLDHTVVVNEIRFINNGVDVTDNIKENTPDTDDNSLSNSLDDHIEEVGREAKDVLHNIEENIENGVDTALNVKNEVTTEIAESKASISDKMETKLDEARHSVETAAKKAASTATAVRDSMGTAAKKAATDVRESVETTAKRAATVASDVGHSVETTAKKAATAASDVGHSMEAKAKKAATAVNEMGHSVETTAKKAAAGARDAVDTVGENAKRVATDTKHTVEGFGSSAMKVATGAKNAVGNVFIKMSDGTKDAVDSVAENISTLLQGKNSKQTANEDDNMSISSGGASKEGGAKTNTTTGEDDERTTASVNSTQNSTGNPFEGNNPFDNELDNVVERSKQAVRAEIRSVEHHVVTETERGKNKVQQFFSDIRQKGKGMSCRNEKSLRVDDEPPRYTVEDEFPTPARRGQQNNNTSKICSIL